MDERAMFEFVQRVRKQSENRCARCGVQHGTRFVVTNPTSKIAHLVCRPNEGVSELDYSNPKQWRALCQRCVPRKAFRRAKDVKGQQRIPGT